MEDTLFFFSRSAHKVPGKGANEHINDLQNYQKLSLIPNWRRMLSNFYVCPFEVEGFRWNTVEHMLHSYKISLGDAEKAYIFCLNSGSELSQGDGEVARNNRKLVILSNEQLKEWERIKDLVLHTALYAKFSQNEALKEALLSTGNAQLYHGAPRIPKLRQHVLERVRQDLRNGN